MNERQSHSRNYEEMWSSHSVLSEDTSRSDELHRCWCCRINLRGREMKREHEKTCSYAAESRFMFLWSLWSVRVSPLQTLNAHKPKTHHPNLGLGINLSIIFPFSFGKFLNNFISWILNNWPLKIKQIWGGTDGCGGEAELYSLNQNTFLFLYVSSSRHTSVLWLWGTAGKRWQSGSGSVWSCFSISLVTCALVAAASCAPAALCEG